MSSPDITQDEVIAVNQVLTSRWLSGGKFVRQFEEEFADYIGVKHAIAVNSGTAGLHLACLAVDKPGYQYLTSPFSFVASANCVRFLGKKPHFADISEKSLNLDYPPGYTEVIIGVDIFGQPFNRDAYPKRIIIEDACEAIGAYYKDQKAGTLGDISVFAFYPNKQITTGEGGMVCTNNDEWAEVIRSLVNQGRGGKDYFDHVRVGYNYRLDEMSCALGLAQLQRIDEILEKREQVAHWYTERLKDRIELLPIRSSTTKMSWFVYIVMTDDRDSLMFRLAENGIPSRRYFQPIHLMPMYGYKEGSFPNAERAGKRCLALPFSGVMTEKEVDYVCNYI